MLVILGIIIAVIIFGLIIFVHELGHFITAKKCGILVHEFAMGMGPIICSKHKGEKLKWGSKGVEQQTGETLYSLRAVPFGGFCAMEGEESVSNDERSFSSKSVPKRMIVIVAGAFMNLLLGLVLLLILTIFFQDTMLTTTISDFKTHSTSENKLQKGDELIKIGSTHIFTTDDIEFQMLISNQTTFDVVVKRDGKKMKIQDVTFDYYKEYYFDENTKKDVLITQETVVPQGAEIKQIHDPFDFTVERGEKNALTVIGHTFKSEATYIQLIFTSLRELIFGKVELKEMAGPIGIVSTVAQTVSATDVFLDNLYRILNISMLITINVGVFNLLPIPALDGGRFVFLLIEAVRRKKVNPEIEMRIHYTAFLLLMAFMVVVSLSDISNLFRNLGGT